MRLNNNKVLITGAASGIGKALTEKFCETDNIVIAIGRDKNKLEELVLNNPSVIPYQCDVSNPADLEKLSAFIREKHSDLNILVNNAGIQYNYDFQNGRAIMEKIDTEVAINFIAPLKLISLLMPVLQVNDNVAIVNVSSGLALVPKPQAPVYCGTKAGIHIFSRALRFQTDKVRVFEIIPPLVDTGMTRGRGKGKISPVQLADEFMQAFKKDKYEVNIGKVKWLKIINRISPALADKIIQRGSV